jgi:hypothetical protein
VPVAETVGRNIGIIGKLNVTENNPPAAVSRLFPHNAGDVKLARVTVNSDTMETAIECCKNAGAIAKCSGCGEYDVSAGDDAAERNAYARATNARKAGARGFSGMSREEVMDAVKSALQDAGECPRCSALRRDW